MCVFGLSVFLIVSLLWRVSCRLGRIRDSKENGKCLIPTRVLWKR